MDTHAQIMSNVSKDLTIYMQIDLHDSSFLFFKIDFFVVSCYFITSRFLIHPYKALSLLPRPDQLLLNLGSPLVFWRLVRRRVWIKTFRLPVCSSRHSAKDTGDREKKRPFRGTVAEVYWAAADKENGLIAAFVNKRDGDGWGKRNGKLAGGWWWRE